MLTVLNKGKILMPSSVRLGRLLVGVAMVALGALYADFIPEREA